MVRGALVLTAAAALGGCTVVGPDYHVPDAAMVNAPAAQAAFQSAGAVTALEPLPMNGSSTTSSLREPDAMS